ncbi:MAG: M14 family zinc carboxypeptidase, partial [Bacteroidota bacterium]
MLKSLFTLLAFILFFGLQGQKNDLKSPYEFMPHTYGEAFTPHHLLVDYFEYIAENVDHITLQEYGRTNENRPLLLTVISSKRNIQNIEKIRQANLIRAGLLEGEVDWKENTAIVWLGYSVHGNEAAGSESSLDVLYELANKDNKEIQSWLENTVVIMDPAVNPDGYSRYTHWYTQMENTIPNVNE